jgi:crotonobetainyl-CoA:carnitine CoA-transferase CaiB-like acyl-CoA transferase
MRINIMGSNRRQDWTEWSNWVRERDDPRIAQTKPEALDDLVVLDLSNKSFAGCHCSSVLSEHGAEIIRIEPPGGDFIRTCTPYGFMYKGEGLNYLTEGRNKFHITLDLTKPEARTMLKKLVQQADVLIETFPPGTMDEWGVGYEELKEMNPRLIFASITAYGQFGPMSKSKMADYDNIAQARSGFHYDTGEMLPAGKTYEDAPWAIPTKSGPWIAWFVSGSFMAMGILAALHWRALTGKGQALDIATAEAYARIDDFVALWYDHEGQVNERFGNLDTALWLYCFAPTKDGAVFLGGLRLEMWQAFADIVGKWEEWGAGNWTSVAPFTRKEEQLKWSALVFEETQKYTSEQLLNMSLEYSRHGRLAPITCVIAPVLSPKDAMEDPNWKDRGIFTPVSDPVFGDVITAQAQYKMTETPMRTKWVCRPAGYDNEFVYLKHLGLGPTRLKRLRDKGII